MNVRRVLPLLALALLALPLAACGNKEAEITHGETEGAYLNVGDLVYQVQISRQLNPADPEDRGYLVDLPAGESELAPDEAWFAVFVKAWNEGSKPAAAATEFAVTDTVGADYHPLAIGPDNVFAYRPEDVPGNEQIPVADSAASNNPSVNGSLLLFKVKIDSFANRPLELAIHSPLDEEPAEATVDLDV
jgi:hypothetical protein